MLPRHPHARAASAAASLYAKLAVLGVVSAVVASTACGGGSYSGPAPGTVARTPLVHRATADACPMPTGAAPSMGTADGGTTPGGGACQTNADCTSGRNGRCTRIGNGLEQCVYDACYSDAECSAADGGAAGAGGGGGAGGGACACNGGNGGNNVCLSGGCRVDGDCGAGGFCSPTLGSCGHYNTPEAYYCHTADDECVDDQDCATDGSPRGYCAYETTVGHWKCSTSECTG
jgi:hypothetical protein